jgi:cytoskeleton protein RodZ
MGDGGTPDVRHTIGALLRQTRQSYGGEIDRIAATLRIRPAYLEAIEECHYNRLPGPVYALGFIRAYAIHLGLDGDEAVRRFKQEIAGFGVTRDLTFPLPLSERSIPGGSMLLAACILAICGYGLWYYVSSGERARPERVSEVPADLMPPPPRVEAPPAQPEPNPAPAVVVNEPPPSLASGNTPAPPGPAAPVLTPPVSAPPTAAPPLAADARIFGAPAGQPSRVVIRAKAESWVQVRDATHTVVDRVLHAGDTVRLPDSPGLLLQTGNASGLDIDVDGKRTAGFSGKIRRNLALDPDRLSNGAARPQ